MDEPRIRPYAPEDLDTVLEIWEDASRTGHPFLPEAFIARERGRVRDVYIPMCSTWVYERDGKVLGFISLFDHEVGGLFVAPREHRRGIGRALVDFAKRQHAKLDVEVFRDNGGARAFYARCGFVETSEYQHAETARQMLRMRFVRAILVDRTR